MAMTPLEQAHQEAEHIFRGLLPQQGMAVREGQISLCHTMLDTLCLLYTSPSPRDS